MELFLQAIERKEGVDTNGEKQDANQDSSFEPCPSLSFEQRPPQWCIVDKWFTMIVICNDESIKELEAHVYDSDGNTVQELQSEENFTNDKERIRAIVFVDKYHKATFKLKFLNGSRGEWLYIGLHNVGQPDKCLLKSPPIKVQVNRSKRPRDTKKKPVPMVTSLSPNTVPSSGSFVGRKDRMLLIFGNNFQLSGNSPVVKLRFSQSETYLEIRPPDLIWWSENLLECQLPECNQDIEVRVANYDLLFGEGKVLKILDAGSMEEDKPINSISDLVQLTHNHLSLEYIPVDDMEESTFEFLVKVSLTLKHTKEFVLAELTGGGCQRVNIQDIGAVVKIWSKTVNRLLKEVSVTKDGQRFCRNIDNMVLTSKIQLEKIPNPKESIIIVVHLRKESTGQYLIDPLSKLAITAQKHLIVPEGDPDIMQVETNNIPRPITVLSTLQDSTLSLLLKSQTLSEALKSCEITNTKIGLFRTITKCEDQGELDKWEQMLSETLHHLRVHRVELDKRQKEKIIINSIPPSVQQRLESLKMENKSITTIDTKDEDEEDSDGRDIPQEEEDDGREKTIAVPQGPIDGSSNGKQNLVYWKFFNPGTRTFLELNAGKLQIIGSRRIQMLIESVPPNSKFINASLYVQKNDTYEQIDFCSRCKENGIPNVFCVLPRRGREHDYPWITFRITCTSTAKHWKGSPFWIGAEFLLDPTVGNIIKVFSPPIHVQSKVKSKEIQEKQSNKFNMRLSSEIPKTPNAPGRPASGLDNLFALTQHQHSATQLNTVVHS